MCVCVCIQKQVLEDVALGTIIVRVSATDADSGLFAVIEYGLVDGEGKFGITPSTVSVCMGVGGWGGCKEREFVGMFGK